MIICSRAEEHTLEAEIVLGLFIDPGDDSNADSETSEDSFVVVGVGGSREPGNKRELGAAEDEAAVEVDKALAGVVTGGAAEGSTSGAGADEECNAGGKPRGVDAVAPESLPES